MGLIKRLYRTATRSTTQNKQLSQTDIILLSLNADQTQYIGKMSGPYTLGLATFYISNKYEIITGNTSPVKFYSTDTGPKIRNEKAIVHKMLNKNLIHKNQKPENKNIISHDTAIYKLTDYGRNQYDKIVNKIDNKLRIESEYATRESISNPESFVLEVHTMSPDMFDKPIIRTN